MTPVAVIGMACRLPGGIDSPELLWKALLRGDDLITEVPPDRWDCDEFYDPQPGVPGRTVCKWGGFLDNPADFDCEFFGIGEREAIAIDPQQRLLLETSWEAMEHAGLTQQTLAGSATGVFAGVTHGDYTMVAADAKQLEEPYGYLGNSFSMASGRVAYAMRLHGPELLSYATGESVKAETMPSEYRDLLGGLNVDQLKKVAAAFISPDGHSIRYLIQTDLNPFSTAAMDQIDAITAAARGAQPNTALADAKVSVVGLPVVLKDTRDYSDHDLRLIIAMTVCIVLLILIVLLRAIVAPLYLIGSVIVSYLAALGIGVIVFQFLLGQEMHWSIPGLTFVILVAVGADYNMLLISRLREEAVLGVRSGVIRTVASTGGVITAAGLIMAASMYGLVFASLGSVVQGAFVLGTGLLLDTFLVRTVTVPAIAVLVGQANWWLPSSWRPATWWPLGRRRGRAQRTKRKPLLPKEEEEQSPPDDDDLIGLWLHDGLRL